LDLSSLNHNTTRWSKMLNDSPQRSYFQHSDCSRPLTVSLVDCKTHSLFHTLTFLAPETSHICNACDTSTIYSIYLFTVIVSLHTEFVKNTDSHQSGGKQSSQRRAGHLLSTSPSACGRPRTWLAAPPVTERGETVRPSLKSVKLLLG
jgi:hypothetical protein